MLPAGTVDGVATFLDQQVIIAFVTFVLGPVAVVFASNRRSRDKASDEVRTKHSSRAVAAGGDQAALLRALTDWSTLQIGEKDRLDARVRELHAEVDELRLNLASLEGKFALLQTHNRVLAQQVIDLGGKPFPFEKM